MKYYNTNTLRMKKKKTSLFNAARKHKKYSIALLLLIIVNVLLFGIVFKKDNGTSMPTVASASEIESIKKATHPKIKEALYTKLIERVGPEMAQEELYKSGLPFDGETHLLNHTVGDWLYKKYGTDGLVHCKDYFLSSCYHGFVLRAVGDKGMLVLNKVMDKCWSVAQTTATQCAHAIGHGMLAYEGYKNLTKALEDCDKMSQTSENFPTFNCHDGVFMENIYAVHDDGKPSPDRWLSNTDLIYPCNDPQIGEQYRKACWSNQPMWMYQRFQGDFKKVGIECQRLENEEYKKTCFDAIARQIHPSSFNNMQTLFTYCGAMPEEHWVDECLYTNVRSSFSVGDRKIPFAICQRLSDEKKPSCYQALSEIIDAYIVNDEEKKYLCSKIPDKNWVEKCTFY